MISASDRGQFVATLDVVVRDVDAFGALAGFDEHSFHAADGSHIDGTKRPTMTSCGSDGRQVRPKKDLMLVFDQASRLSAIRTERSAGLAGIGLSTEGQDAFGVPTILSPAWGSEMSETRSWGLVGSPRTSGRASDRLEGMIAAATAGIGSLVALLSGAPHFDIRRGATEFAGVDWDDGDRGATVEFAVGALVVVSWQNRSSWACRSVSGPILSHVKLARQDTLPRRTHQ